MARAREQAVVDGVFLAPVASEGGVAHHVPAVLGVERALRRRLAAVREEVVLEEEALHRARGVADAAAAVEDAAADRAADRDVEERRHDPRVVRLLGLVGRERDAQERGALRDRHGAVLVDRLGAQEVLLRVVPAARELPRLAADALVAEVGGDLQPADGERGVLEFPETARAAALLGFVQGAVHRAQPALLPAAEAVVEPVELVVLAAAHPVAGAIAGDVLHGHVLDGAEDRVAVDVEAHRPLRVVRRMLVVVLVVVALDRAVHEVRVADVLDRHDDRMAPRERVLLERRAVEIERHAARQLHLAERAHAVGPGREHDLAEARGGLVVEKLLETLGRRDRGLLDRVRVVALVEDDARLLERADDRLAVLRRDEDGVARRALARRRRVRLDITVERLEQETRRLVALRPLGRVGDLDEDPAPEVAVVADAVFREVLLRDAERLRRGNLEERRLDDAELVPHAVRLDAVAEIDRPDADVVVAGGEFSEVERAVAGRHLALLLFARLAVGPDPLAADREAERVVEEADLRVVPVRHVKRD